MAIGELMQGLYQQDIHRCINIIIVADHGENGHKIQHYISSSFFLLFFFFGHVLFQFLCNLQQYCDSAYNKLNSLQQKEFIDITKMNYIWKRKKEEREGDKHTCTHACTRARTHARTHTRTHARAPTHPPAHTHTQFQTKIQAIKRPNKQIKDDPNKIVLT